ncbi:hypothetical protein HHI36_022815 [Cryptolaemus montrouzieri]|uniref:Vitellogenin n=1 Tax=Cryptolaemus montrouzieri TaxID=559131 RepID=A0ABD2PEG9_9CUCU
MWSPILLCFIVGLTSARPDNPAWKANTEYTYEVRGRSLASLHQIYDQYTGIVLRAKLVVQPQNDDRLRCAILQPEYAEVQTSLPEGWMSHLPENQLNYQPLQMTDKAFEIVMNNGVVRELNVERSVQEWEANIIKSFVSQIQLDTKAQNLIKSQLNVVPKEGSNNAVFKTLEDTITGITETTYDIHPLPEYILQSEPHLAPFPHLKGDGSIVEVVKTKNFTQGYDLPAYYFGLGNSGKWEPESNQFGEILHRTSVSRAVITGTLQRYTIQHSETRNEITVSPTGEGEQKGSVNSLLTIKLANAEQQKPSTQLPEVSSPVNLGSLVYAYGQKESNSNLVGRGRIFQRDQYVEESNESSEERSNYLKKRHPRSLKRQMERNMGESSEDSIESQEDWTEPKSKLNEAPRSPLLPFTTGYKGMSIKHAPNMNIVERVCSIAQQVGQEIQRPEEIPKKYTLAKFVLLTSLIRLMNEQELKQAAERLYTQETESAKSSTWTVFRDAVAESGTGPAFLAIKDWIQNKKIQDKEAAYVVVTMGQSVRQPTEEYIRAFYEQVKKQISTPQQSDSMLNETMLFSLSSLVNKVYVNKRVSHRQYPTHSFGTFDTKEGRAFVKNDLIPYLTKQLREAINGADSRKTFVYIRALGLCAHREIIYAFEPYLEGKVHCSQFQRFLMVLALQNVARIEPKTVGPILYRIYQNTGETTEVRVAAVYMLMLTNPSADMLQRMAMYTKLEANHKVCAAVKSAIESVSELKGREFDQVRSAAKSAKPYLTTMEFGMDDSFDYLKSYVSSDWESYYKNRLSTYVTEESGLPSSLQYRMTGKENGYKYNYISLDSVISDIRNLFHVFTRQTEWRQEQQNKQQAAQQSEKSEFASHKIAQLLNLKTEELEQLEGGIILQIAEWEEHFLYNNHSIERLPQMLAEIENVLESGKKISYSKLINYDETAIALPTEIGVPFLIAYDTPMLMKVEGKLHGKVQPKMSSGTKMIWPNNVEIEGELKIVLAGKQHTEFGLFTPFNHQHYCAGYDRNMQINMPIRTKVNIDLVKRNVQYEVEPLESDRNANIFHKSSWPYVSKHDILSLETTAERKSTHVLRKPNQNQWQKVLGEKSVGLAFRVKHEYDGKHSSIDCLMRGHIFDSNIQYEQIDIEYMPQQSQNKKMKVNFSYQSKEQNEYQQDGNEASREALFNKLSQLPKGDEQRLSEVDKEITKGVRNARVYVMGSSIEFSGKENVEYSAVMAYAHSRVEPDCQVLAYVRKQSQRPGSRPFEATLSAKVNMPKISGLDMEYNMKADLTSTAAIEFAFAEKLPTSNKVKVHAQLGRSESRKEYLMKQPAYQRCQREMQHGNKQLKACANMTQEFGLLDQIKLEIKYPNSRPKDLDNILQAYNEWASCHHFDIEENRQPKEKQGEVTVNVRFYPDLQRVNVSVSNQNKYAYIKQIDVNEYGRRIAVMHPGFDVFDRLEGKMYGLQTYKPICSMDKTEAYSFDGAEYPLILNNYWTVLLQYVPLRSSPHSQRSVDQQLRNELVNYAILARQSNQGAQFKDVKIVVATPETEGKIIEVTMKPKSGGKYPEVSIDGKPMTPEELQQSKTYQREVIVGHIANGEIYVKVRKAFYVIYDGSRVKITALSTSLRNRLRGACGNFDGNKADDFITPNNCVVRDPKEFIASYTVLRKGEQNQEIMDLKSRSQKNHCTYMKIPLYVDYISDRAERQHQQNGGSCSKYQTRYIMEDGKICFTIKPLTVCRSECHQRGAVFKKVEVHCVENKNVATLWKSQIDKGASPDFSQKPVTKTIQMEIPQSCRSS